MPVDEALRLLRVDRSATHAEIEDAYREGIRRVHPDGSHPDDAMAASFNVARDVAMGAATLPGTGLVRVADVAALVRLAMNAPTEQRERRDSSREQIAQVVLLHRGRIQSLRRRQFAIAFLIGGVAAIGTLVGALTKVERGFDTRETITLATRYAAWFPAMGAIGFVGAMLALSAFLIKSRVEWLERSIEEAATALGDRQTLVRTVRELDLSPTWTSDDLQHAVEKWSTDEVPVVRTGPRSSPFRLLRLRQPASVPLRGVAALVGNVDFTRMLLARGTEIGVLREEPTECGDGTLEYRFRLARPGDVTA